MALKNKKFGPVTFAAIVVIICAVSQYQYSRHNQIASAVPQAKAQNLQSLVGPQDVAPLPVPQQAIAKGRTIMVPILMYHHIGVAPQMADATHKSLTVSIADFEKQLQWLSQNGFPGIALTTQRGHFANLQSSQVGSSTALA